MCLYKILRPLLFSMDAETAHNLTLKALKSGAAPHYKAPEAPQLHQTLWGLPFQNPIGLAAGFDKNAEVIAPILRLGFGFCEAGTVTPKAQTGNPKPRVFRDPSHGAVINRMGFPNQGMDVFKRNFLHFENSQSRPAGPVGLNIGMNKNQTEAEADYAVLIQNLAPLADYLTINISSPNTPGLRDLQDPAQLKTLLHTVIKTRNETCPDAPPPLLLKLAPDLENTQVKDIAAVVLQAGIDGLILTNTTLARPDTLSEGFKAEKGGLSGQPLTQRSTDIIRKFYNETGGQIPIIGAGGVSTAAQAYDKIKAGASLIQLYSALIYQGPKIAINIQKGLIDLLHADGLSSISDAIGLDHQ